MRPMCWLARLSRTASEEEGDEGVSEDGGSESAAKWVGDEGGAQSWDEEGVEGEEGGNVEVLVAVDPGWVGADC